GYGTMRILDALDFDAIRDDPKVVMGYSDLTAIVNAIPMRSGVIAFHGPVAAHGSSYSGVAREYFERTLMSPDPVGVLHAPDAQRIAPGRARGRLAGGNLSLVSALQGTPFAVPLRDAIFFFEETQEQPYRIDRMLTQLALGGALRDVRAALFGQCTGCAGDAPTAEEVIAERLRSLHVPALTGAPFGHVPTQWILPVGLDAELDADAQTLTLLEAAVSP
ncbi:MAG TPA: LD-carboxypeptidase, partial [Verrucomicrobiae bacterium]|nr:LD-carboxypeptidase [Verrucomicrobiae bacterium]